MQAEVDEIAAKKELAEQMSKKKEELEAEKKRMEEEKERLRKEAEGRRKMTNEVSILMKLHKQESTKVYKKKSL
jgi:hypothetical protein